MGWLIALGVLTGLAMLPLGVSARYNTDGPQLRLIAGPVRLTVFPRKKKAAKPRAKKPQNKQKSAASKSKEAKDKGGSITDFLPLLRIVLDFISGFKRKLRVNRLEMRLILGGDDPCDLAINYGRAWAALGNLMPHLEHQFVIKKRDLEVECDFTSGETRVFAWLDLTITLGRLLMLAVCYGIRAVREYLNILKLRKGGAKI